MVPLGMASATRPWITVQPSSAARRRAMQEGPENIVPCGGTSLPRSLRKDSRPVGMGPKVLVSVASAAVKTRMGDQLSVTDAGVQQRIAQVHAEVEQHVGHRKEQHHALDH